MSITLQQFFIVCPFVFLAGFVDSIAGGGGMISLPAYLFAGLPVHNAIATNKFSSSTGCIISTSRYLKNKCYNKRLLLPTIAAALIGSTIGAHLALLTDEKYLKWLLLILLPIVAIIVFRKKDFLEAPASSSEISWKKQLILSTAAALIIGCYDGFYGPGTGTFLILVFTGIIKLDVKEASGNTKCVNLASNIAALVTFLINGKVILLLGLIASFFSILGNFLGSGLVIKNGSRIVRPIILIVILLLFIKIISGN